MSEYENVVVGKLRLKGKALGVKGEGIRKKKKTAKKQFDNLGDDLSSGRNFPSLIDCAKENINDVDIDGDNGKEVCCIRRYVNTCREKIPSTMGEDRSLKNGEDGQQISLRSDSRIQSISSQSKRAP